VNRRLVIDFQENNPRMMDIGLIVRDLTSIPFVYVHEIPAAYVPQNNAAPPTKPDPELTSECHHHRIFTECNECAKSEPESEL
jgi:hypothetical protein